MMSAAWTRCGVDRGCSDTCTVSWARPPPAAGGSASRLRPLPTPLPPRPRQPAHRVAFPCLPLHPPPRL